jgi:hypothetical protein
MISLSPVSYDIPAVQRHAIRWAREKLHDSGHIACVWANTQDWFGRDYDLFLSLLWGVEVRR